MGFQAFSPSYKVEKSVPALEKAVQAIMVELHHEGLTFKISSKRSDHQFELDSRELNQVLGSAVFAVLPDIKAQMNHPNVNLKVERFVRKQLIFLMKILKERVVCLLVQQVRVSLMLSGGIDSPVAGYLALKEALILKQFILPVRLILAPGALKKAQDLTRKLTKFGGNIQFIEVPFTEIQEEIKAKAPEAYLMTLTRRFMMRIADRIPRKSAVV